jgi:hypothetical protein
VKYVAYNESSGWDLQPYFAYLEMVKAQMPVALYVFAASIKNYDLASPTSLHDAWLEQLIIRDPGGERVEVVSSYIGPLHDWKIHLIYRSVLGYSFIAPQGAFPGPPVQSGHGDLLMHEVRVIGLGAFEHELVFSKGAAFTIQFENFEHRTEAIGART